MAIVGAALAFAIAGAAVNLGVHEIPGMSHSDTKRHNVAIEQISKEREKFSEDRINSIDLHNKRLAHINESTHEWNETEQEMSQWSGGGGQQTQWMGSEDKRQTLPTTIQELSTILTITTSLITIYLFSR